jgi:hypothetical protein
MLFRYESTPGSAGRPATVMPEAPAAAVSSLPRLVVSIHPRCACSRATIGELARIMAACYGRLETRVLMVRPAGEAAGWEKTDLWTSAARIPGVTVVTDVDGAESQKFGAETSGHALLYDGGGKLMFSGGITESRGHAGDNDGESAILALVGPAGKPDGGQASTTPVYGCGLFDQRNVPHLQGGGR